MAELSLFVSLSFFSLFFFFFFFFFFLVWSFSRLVSLMLAFSEALSMPNVESDSQIPSVLVSSFGNRVELSPI